MIFSCNQIRKLCAWQFYNYKQTTFRVFIRNQNIMDAQADSLQTQYDQPIRKIQQLNSLLQKLANKQSLEDLADQTAPEDYMNLIANLIYSLHSTMFCYAHVKGQQMPEQFKKVKQYYTKIKDVLAGKLPKKQMNPLQVDKEAATRMIKAGIKQDPATK